MDTALVVSLVIDSNDGIAYDDDKMMMKFILAVIILMFLFMVGMMML